MGAYNIMPYLLMHIGFLIYSLYTVLGKYAARYDAFSFSWCCFYAAIVGVLGLYAILWQQVLKKVRLPIAMCNKAVTIVWGMLFSALLFGEQITLKKILGAAIILCGILLLSAADKDNAASDSAAKTGAAEGGGQ